MADYKATDTDLTAVANAIRAKGGTSAQLEFPDGFVSAIEGIGGDNLYKNMLEARATAIVDDQLTRNTGWYPTGVVSAVFNQLTTTRAFDGFSALKAYIAPKVTAMPTLVFRNCTALKYVWMPIATGATSNGNTSNQRKFYGCSAIEHLYLGGWKYIGYQEFSSNNAIKTITFDALVTMAAVPASFSNFIALIIRKTNTSLNSGTAFDSTPIGTGNGYIYVPASAVSTYKSATNWVNYASKIIGIDEDTTATKGVLFTPTVTATGIVSYDMIDLQSYSTGTINSSTGAITPTCDGRMLIRGLDGNGVPLHVTYLKVGTGFDPEEMVL